MLTYDGIFPVFFYGKKTKAYIQISEDKTVKSETEPGKGTENDGKNAQDEEKMTYKQLLKLANTREGKHLLSSIGSNKVIGNVVSITKNSFVEHIEGDIYRGSFFSKHPVATLFLPIIEKMNIADEYRRIENITEAFGHFSGLTETRNYPSIYLASATYNPGTSTNSPVDGYVGRSAVDEAYATIRAGAGNDANVGTSTSSGIYIAASTTTNQFGSIYRFIWGFDTSPLTAAATITAATITLYANEKANAIGDQVSHIAAATPAAWTTLANSDYAQTGATSFANLSYAGVTASDNNVFTLDANGIANISKTGISGFSLKDGWDIAGTFGGSWSSGANSHIWYNTADSASNKPTLTITYTLPTSSGDFKFL